LVPFAYFKGWEGGEKMVLAGKAYAVYFHNMAHTSLLFFGAKKQGSLLMGRLCKFDLLIRVIC
jgi:hypothetical protein